MPQRSLQTVLICLLSLLVVGCGASDEFGAESSGAAEQAPVQDSTQSPGDMNADTEYCDFLISDAVEGFESIDQIAWFSHEIVLATVEKQLESRKVPGGPTPEVPYYIVTDYEIRVDERLRGSASDADLSMTIQSWGGSLDGCAQTFSEWPPFEVGDQALFFLRIVEGKSSRLYDVFGRHQGYWEVNSTGIASTKAVHLLPRAHALPIQDLTTLVRDALRNGPPAAGPQADSYLVPLADAPLVEPAASP